MDHWPRDLMKEHAVFSADRRYRYSLMRRIHDADGPPCLFIMLNPSIADEVKMDPTVTRCQGFASGWGFHRLYVANLFAYRATNPKEMRKAEDPVSEGGGVHNDFAIGMMLYEVHSQGGKVVCAWGNHGRFRSRSTEFLDQIWRIPKLKKVPLHHLGLTKWDEPRHPLYLRSDLEPVEWT